MGVGKYTRDERVIIRLIENCTGNISHHNRRVKHFTEKRQALIDSLAPKYKPRKVKNGKRKT